MPLPPGFDFPVNAKPTMPRDSNNNAIPVVRLGACQKLTSVTSSTPQATTAIASRVFFIYGTQPFHLKTSATNSAALTDMLFPSGQVFAFACEETDVVSVIADSVTGDVYVTPAASPSGEL